MEWVSKLKHYQDYDGIEDKQLLDEAIATCEAYFKVTGEHELLHYMRPLAICYLALKYEKSNKNNTNK